VVPIPPLAVATDRAATRCARSFDVAGAPSLGEAPPRARPRCGSVLKAGDSRVHSGCALFRSERPLRRRADMTIGMSLFDEPNARGRDSFLVRPATLGGIERFGPAARARSWTQLSRTSGETTLCTTLCPLSKIVRVERDLDPRHGARLRVACVEERVRVPPKRSPTTCPEGGGCPVRPSRFGRGRAALDLVARSSVRGSCANARGPVCVAVRVRRMGDFGAARPAVRCTGPRPMPRPARGRFSDFPR